MPDPNDNDNVTGIFNNINLQNLTIFVPLGSINSYRNADYWKELGNIVEYSDEKFEDFDIYGDGVIDEEDVTILIDSILDFDPSQETNPAYDVNNDGKVSVSDIVKMIGYKLNNPESQNAEWWSIKEADWNLWS